MGATLPVVARGLVARDAALGRASAWLYAANTLRRGARRLRLRLLGDPAGWASRARVLAAGALNLAVGGGCAFACGRELRAPAPAPEPDAPSATAHGARAPSSSCFFFAVSGFVAIGYEIVWSKVFGIVMEGTLYGFAAVLSAVLLGIALGSAAIAGRVDRLARPARAPSRCCTWRSAPPWCSASAAVPYLPWLYERLASAAPARRRGAPALPAGAADRAAADGALRRRLPHPDPHLRAATRGGRGARARHRDRRQHGGQHRRELAASASGGSRPGARDATLYALLLLDLASRSRRCSRCRSRGRRRARLRQRSPACWRRSAW